MQKNCKGYKVHAAATDKERLACDEDEDSSEEAEYDDTLEDAVDETVFQPEPSIPTSLSPNMSLRQPPDLPPRKLRRQQPDMADDDAAAADDEISRRLNNHESSSRSKAPKVVIKPLPDVHDGDIVFVKSHGSKHHLRDPHIVISSTDQSAVNRIAMHSNSEDGRPLSLAPSNKIVAKKFIYRPKHLPSRTPDIPEVDEYDHEPHLPPDVTAAKKVADNETAAAKKSGKDKVNSSIDRNDHAKLEITKLKENLRLLSEEYEQDKR